MAFCSMCGKSIPDTAAFCPYCGSKTEDFFTPIVTEAPASIPEPAPVAPTPVMPEPPQDLTPPEPATVLYSEEEPLWNPVYPPEYPQSEAPASGLYTIPVTEEYMPSPADSFTSTAVYEPVPVLHTQTEAPPKKHEMPWKSDPRAKEAAELAAKTATQTVSGVMDAYKKALAILFTKPIMLWGLSLLYNLLTVLAVVFSLLPIIWLPINLVLQLGVSSVYLSGIRGQQVNSDALFAGFREFFKNAGGMGWKALWTIIWAGGFGVLVVVAAAAFSHGGSILQAGKYLDFGLFKQLLAIIELFLAAVAVIAGLVIFTGKNYAYSFVPYILLSEPDISATEALRRSMKLTRGWKLKMFAADAAVFLSYAIIVGIFTALTALTDGFFLFTILLVIIELIGGLLGPMFFGLLHAGFYEMAGN